VRVNARGKGGDVLRRRKFRLARVTVVTVWILSLITVIGANRNDVVQAGSLGSVWVSIHSDGAERQVRTAQTTVGATLAEAGIVVGPLDVVTPSTNQRPTEGMVVKVVRVKEMMEEVKEPIAFDTVRQFSGYLRPGQVKVIRQGENGERVVRYLVRYEDGVPVRRIALDSKVVRQPKNKVITIGSRGRYTSRGMFRSRRIMSMSASAYDPGPRSCGKHADGYTGSGLNAGRGVVAVDPRVIPLGTRLYIEGYGHAIAGDTGGAIKGRRIDLGFNTYREAIRFGRRKVIVHVLE
jgi:3D (Asp-Asp-Asp) domain-containing protein